MNLVANPVIPLGWWVVVMIVTIFAIISWGVYAKSKKTLNGSWFLSVGVITALLLAMLNPGIPTSASVETIDDSEDTEQVESNYDVYLVVDTTSSIAAEDWNGDEPRLVGVKSDIVDIVEQYPNSRFTLITFDSVATMRVPITNDSSAILSTVGALQQEVTGNSKGSSVTEASEMLADVLQKNEDKTKQSIVFFFSDGEQTSDSELGSFADSAPYISSGLVLGYGTDEGGRMKSRIGYAAPGEPYIKGADGVDGLSTIDEANLETIATDLGLKYLHRVFGEPLDVSPDSDESVIGNIDTKRFGVFGIYWIFALVAFLLMALALSRTVYDIKRYSVRAAKKGVKNG